MAGTTDLNLLRAFVAVAETASFSTAAKRLGQPKSSVSRGIKKLESDLGVTLVHRTTRSVALSTAGEELLARVGRRLGELECVLSDLPELEALPTGDLRVTASQDFGGVVLAEVASRFVARYPGVRIDMHLSNTVVDLVAEGYDVAFRISMKRLKDSALHARKVGPIEMGIYASPTYVAKQGAPKTPADLDGHTWVGFRGNDPLLLSGPGKDVTVERPWRVRGDDMAFVRDAVRAGGGLGVLPAFLVDEDVAAGALVRVLQRWSVPQGDLYIVHHGGPHLPKKLVAFRDFALEALAARGIKAAG